MNAWYITKKSLVATVAIAAAIALTGGLKWAASHLK